MLNSEGLVNIASTTSDQQPVKTNATLLRSRKLRRLRRKFSRGEKSYDLLKLVVGFFLTGIIGTVVTQFYKERETQEQLERDSLKAATAVFYDIIDTCDKRHFYALRLWAAYQNYLPPEQIAAAWKRYDDVVISWNETRIRNQALLATYFGSEIEEELTVGIIKEFHEVHTGLMKIKSDYQKLGCFSDETGDVKAKIDKLDDTLTDFSDDMQHSLAARQQSKGILWNPFSRFRPTDFKIKRKH